MLSLLRSGRWLGFTATAVVAIIAFGLLSLWQWHRAEQKQAEFAVVAAAMSADPVPAAQVGTATPWQRVTATGTYDDAQQYLVRNRPQNGANGFQVVTLLRPADAGDPALWVVRGFLPATAAAAREVTVPDPPAGVVTVDGYARLSDTDPVRAAADVPAGQITAVNVAGLDALASVTTTPWYLLAARDPGLAPVELPAADDGRNLSYAGQWLLFAAIAVGGWYYFLRREANEVAAAAAPQRSLAPHE